MKRWSCFATGLLALVLLVPSVSAQELPTAMMREDATYYVVSYTKFKPGMADEARKIIYDHFWPVDREMGREVIPFDHMTGEWDHVVYFPLDEGPGELAWEMSPTGEAWMAAFVEREGSMEEAEALWKRFSELVAETKTDLVMTKWRSAGDN